MTLIDKLGNQNSGLLTSSPVYLELSEEDRNKHKTVKGKTLEELFAQEQFKSSKEKTETISLIRRMINFCQSFTKEQTQSLSKSHENQKMLAAIDFTPVIDKPDNFDFNLLNLKLSKSIEPTCEMSDQQIYDGLSQMSEQTMYRVMMIILAAQNDLERDGALLNLDDLDKFQKMQKLQQKVMKELKLALVADEKMKGYFKTAQNILVAVGVLSTLASFVGIVIPAAYLAAAVGGAISTAGKSYFDVRTDEDKAKLIAADHDTKIRQRHIEDTSNRLGRHSEADTDKQFSKLLKGMIELLRMINS